MENRKNIIVFGAGGHARSVCDVLLEDKAYNVIGLIDPFAKEGFFGLPILGGDAAAEELFHAGTARAAFVALGDNALRKRLSARLVEIGFEMVNAISSRSKVSRYASIGSGVVVMPGAIINAGAAVGDGCIVNTNCSLDHDVRAGNFCHIAPGVTVCGTVHIGEETFIGAGASVIDCVSIGRRVMIGAGAAVVRDVPDGATAVGVPARVIKT